MIKNILRLHGMGLLAACLLVGMTGLFLSPGHVFAQDDGLIQADSEDIPEANVQLFNQWVRFLSVIEENLALALVVQNGNLIEFSILPGEEDVDAETGEIVEPDQTLALFTNILQGLVTSGEPEDYLALMQRAEEHNAAVDMMNAYLAQLQAHQDAFETIHDSLPPLDKVDFDEDVVDVIGDRFFVIPPVDEQLHRTPSSDGGGGE